MERRHGEEIFSEVLNLETFIQYCYLSATIYSAKRRDIDELFKVETFVQY